MWKTIGKLTTESTHEIMSRSKFVFGVRDVIRFVMRTMQKKEYGEEEEEEHGSSLSHDLQNRSQFQGTGLRRGK